jgi:hypothetical protein
MSAFDVLHQFGTAAFLRFVVAAALFLAVHLVRIPVVLLAAVLEGVMHRVDRYAARQAAHRPRKPANHYFAGGVR